MPFKLKITQETGGVHCHLCQHHSFTHSVEVGEFSAHFMGMEIVLQWSIV